MNKPLVSIIIPVFNAEKYLDEAIQSALGQTWPNKEVIIIDDGSTDNSLPIARAYENKQVKILTQKNKGASAARNLGLKEANGEYIQFLDADDLLSKNKIESQIALLIGFPDHLALCGTVHFQSGTEPTSCPVQHDWYAQGTNDPVDFLLKLYGGPLIGPEYGGMIQPNAWLTPRNLVLKAGLWNEMLNLDDDGEFFCRMVLASEGVKYSATGINYYRKHRASNTLSAAKSREAYESIILSIGLKYSHLKERTNAPILKRVFSRHYWEIGVATYPQYKQLSKKAITKALEFGFDGRKYKGGPVSTFLSTVIGWRVVRILTYLRYKI